jgi:transcriptional regulator with XRE-family HTH domain
MRAEVTMAGIDVRHLGDYIRDQRRDSNVSLRQLAKLAGVSNPYLSQIERGLRKPSAEILQQIAKALRISAEALYVQAGILEQREGSGLVADAVLADEGLNERQKQVLLEIYDSFRTENAAKLPPPPPAAVGEQDTAVGAAEPLAPVAASAEAVTDAPPAAGRTPARPPRTTARKASAPTAARKSANPTTRKRTSKGPDVQADQGTGQPTGQRASETGTTPTPNDTAPGGNA